MNKLKLILIFTFGIGFFSCSEDEVDKSTVSRFTPFGFETIPDKLVFQEADTTIFIPFTFNDNQIFDLEVDISVGSGSTAEEDVDFALGTHSISLKALEKKGVIEFIIGTDVFKEDDEKVFLVLSSASDFGLPLTKTVEITIKNVGGCPAYIHNDFVGTYTVESDEWQDWAVGTDLEVVNEGINKLSFKYNCGGDALPILLNINPATFGISGDKQPYCSYDLPPLTVFSADIVEASSQVNTCEKTLTVAIAHSDANGSNYGSGIIVLKKK